MTVEDIVVTARRQEEKTLDAPLAVSAFSRKDLDEGQLTEIRDLANVSPGLSYLRSGGSGSAGRSNGQIVFRGLSTTYGSSREQSGSAFVDGIYIPTGVGSLSTIDVERVEVLKGPQSTYFGRNTFGGAINFITRVPSDEFRGQIDGLGTVRGSHDLTASVEGALIPGKIAARITAYLHKRAGDYTATDGGKLGEEGTKSINGHLFITPSDAFSVKLRVHYQKNEDGPGTNILLRGTRYGSTCPGQTFSGRTAAGAEARFALSRPYFCGTLPSLGSYGDIITQSTSLLPGVLQRIGKPTLFRDILVNNSLNSPILAKAPDLDEMGLAQTIGRASISANYTLPSDISITTNISYSDTRTLIAFDADRTDEENTYQATGSTDEDLNFELRVQSSQENRLRWLAGMNYYWYKAESQNAGYQINTGLGQTLPTAGFLNAASSSVNKIIAGFAAAEFDIFEGLSLSGEVRFQSDKTTSTTAKIKTDKWLPRIILKYKPAENTTLYANYAQGIQQTQLNGGYATYSDAQKAEIEAVFPGAGVFAPLPTLTSYDFGIKQRTLGGRLQFAVSGYYMNWENINTIATVISTTAPFNLSIVAPNDAKLWGIEMDAQAVISRNINAEFTFNYRNSEYTRFFNPTLGSLTSGVTYFGGNKIPKTPSYTGSIALTYHADINDKWSWFARTDAFYTGKQWDSEANIVQLNDFVRVNARVGFRKDNLSVELFARNLFDDKNWDSIQRTTSLGEPGALLFVPYPLPTSGQTTVQGLALQAPDRREIGLRFSKKF